MKSNLNSADRIIRILLAVVMSLLYFTGQVTGTTGIALLIIAGVLLLTSMISFCPLYHLMGISTATKKQ